ncbi:hypothetical protein H0H93_011899 [Arthromyces matolae]|nr:hypothetical protein H0H93_011899 [Arthromyces matolae]
MKRAHSSNTAPASSSKKTRFVDPGDDPTRFEDDVNAALENPSHRRNRVRNEGYESDSSDDGEGVVESRKNKPADDEDDDDMFAIGEKDDKKDDVPSQKKDQYLRLGDIEGQEFMNSGSESEEESEPEDEDDAERRKKAGMGFELSSFNMREEMEEGKFTADGSYVRTVDPHGVHDRWMDGVSDREIKQARRRKRLHDKVQRERMETEAKELEQSGGVSNLELQLLALLKKGETVLEALQRLGVLAKKSQKLQKHAESVNESKVPAQIETITHLASNIMELGDTDIYSKTYEELVRAVRSSGKVESSWEPPSADVRYEYKWDMPNATQTDEVFGPFSEEEMKTWMKASWFGPAGENVKVRAADGQWGDWDDVFP